MTKSELYLSTLPMLTSHRVRLLDLDFVVDEFASLERKTGAAGHDRVDNFHGHEDAANAVAGVIAHLSAAKPQPGTNILEFYRRESEAITNPPKVEAAPQAVERYAFIGAQRVVIKDAVRVVVPPRHDITSMIAASGLTHNVSVEDGCRVIYLNKDDATALLTGGMPSSHQWVESNRALAAQLRENLPPAFPVGLKWDDVIPRAPRSLFDRGGIVNDTLRDLGIMR
jgi:hypothetical protein